MRLQTGDTEEILFLVLKNNGTPDTGLTTIRLRILRLSDDQLLDFADNTFKAAGHTTIEATMTELDATNAPGIYELAGGFNTGALVNPNVDDTYLIIPRQTSGNSVLPFPSTLPVGQWADDIGKIDDFVTTPPATATTGSLLDRLANKDANKTYDQSTDSLEALGEHAQGQTGARQVTIHVDDATPLPLPNVDVSIFAADNATFLTRGVTDSNGNVVFALDDNSFNARLFKAGFNFTVPEPFTVTADQTFNFAGTPITISPPSAPDLCVIFGTIRDAAGDVQPGVCVQARAVVPQALAGTQFDELLEETVTDENGFFQIELVRGAEVRFIIEVAGIDFIKFVPNLASQDVTTWP